MDVLLGAHARDLLHVPDDALTFVSEGQRTAVVGWQTGAERFGGTHWHRDQRGLTGFSGWLWPSAAGWPSERGWAAQVAEVAGRGPGHVRDSYSGTYSVLHVEPSGAGWLTSDPMDSGLVYLAHGEGFVAVSNRADLAAAAVGSVRDGEAVAWLPYAGYFLDDRTSFEGVRVLGPARALRFGNGLVEEEFAPFWRVDEQAVPTAGDLDAVAASLTREVEAVARSPVPGRLVLLSGGKDSRLVMAAIAAAGCLDRFDYATAGIADDPDVLVAGMLADHLGIELERRVPSQVRMSPDEFDQRVREHVFLTSGMFGPWDLKHVGVPNDRVILSGLFGEVLRSHYAAGATLGTDDDARAFFRESMEFDPAGLLRAEAATALSRRVADWVDDQLSAGVPPADVPDVFYANFRIRRWVGSAQEANARHLHANPLQNIDAARAAFRAGHATRARDGLHFELIRRLHDPLARIPLANEGWSEDNFGGVEGAGRYGPQPVRRTDTRPRVWQESEWARLREVFSSVLLRPDHPIHSLLDPARLDDAIADYRTLGQRAKVSLWGALGAALWLERGERVRRHEERPRRPVAVTDPARPSATLVCGLVCEAPDGGDLTRDPLLGTLGDPEVAAFCDVLLARAGASVGHLPDGFAAALVERTGDLVPRAHELIASRRGDLTEARLALTLPFWQRISDPVVVLVNEAPARSVASTAPHRLLSAAGIVEAWLDITATVLAAGDPGRIESRPDVDGPHAPALPVDAVAPGALATLVHDLLRNAQVVPARALVSAYESTARRRGRGSSLEDARRDATDAGRRAHLLHVGQRGESVSADRFTAVESERDQWQEQFHRLRGRKGVRMALAAADSYASARDRLAGLASRRRLLAGVAAVVVPLVVGAGLLLQDGRSPPLFDAFSEGGPLYCSGIESMEPTAVVGRLADEGYEVYVLETRPRSSRTWEELPVEAELKEVLVGPTADTAANVYIATPGHPDFGDGYQGEPPPQDCTAAE